MWSFAAAALAAAPPWTLEGVASVVPDGPGRYRRDDVLLDALPVDPGGGLRAWTHPGAAPVGLGFALRAPTRWRVDHLGSSVLGASRQSAFVTTAAAVVRLAAPAWVVSPCLDAELGVAPTWWRENTVVNPRVETFPPVVVRPALGGTAGVQAHLGPVRLRAAGGGLWIPLRDDPDRRRNGGGALLEVGAGADL